MLVKKQNLDSHISKHCFNEVCNINVLIAFCNSKLTDSISHFVYSSPCDKLEITFLGNEMLFWRIEIKIGSLWLLMMTYPLPVTILNGPIVKNFLSNDVCIEAHKTHFYGFNQFFWCLTWNASENIEKVSQSDRYTSSHCYTCLPHSVLVLICCNSHIKFTGH